MKTFFGHCFRDEALLEEALTTPSCDMDRPGVAYNLRLEFLGDAIPARSFATGANETSGLSQNLSLATCRGNESKWPEERKDGNNKFWRHSDFKNLAYPFTRKLFDKIVND